MKYLRPVSVAEAVSMMSDHPGAKVMAGGTDLMCRWRAGEPYPVAVVDVSHLEELKTISMEGNRLFIGAGVTFDEVAQSPVCGREAPLLGYACSQVGVWQVRNRGTIGGNIANASPVADSVPPLIALNAQLHLRGSGSIAERQLGTIFKGPGRTDLDATQLLTGVSFKVQSPAEIYFYEKLGQRRAQCIAKVSVAFRASLTGGYLQRVSVILGAVGPTVLRAVDAERALEGQHLSRELLRRVIWLAADNSTPITDLRSEKNYRHDMIAAIMYRNLLPHVWKP